MYFCLKSVQFFDTSYYLRRMIRNILLVGLGGAAGAMLRYGITLVFTFMHWSTNIGTLLTNVIGSFVMGMLVSAFEQSPMLLFATVGLCGGFTTFSTFSMQSVTLLQQGRYGAASLYIFGTMLLCVGCAALGCIVARKLGI